MRTGKNPAKVNPELAGYAHHRIIIPVYIPCLSGYFEHSLEVLKLCFESLRLTTIGKASITVVSNGSAPEVVKELDKYYQEGWVDQLILNRTNRGKVDAVVSVARGCFEELITISDCDVLFKSGWLEAVESVFHSFPECGFVAPMPNPNFAFRHNSSTILGAIARRELTYEKIVPDEDLDRFAHSIGNSDFFKPERRERQLVIRRNGASACLGCGHFVFTIRKEVVKGMPRQPSQMAIEGDSEETWLDMPADKLGLWRLATTRAYAYHMGNVLETWMYDELRQCERKMEAPVSTSNSLGPVLRHWTSRSWPGRRLVARLIMSPKTRRFFLGLLQKPV